MRFYEAETFGDEAGRHVVFAITDLDVDNPIAPYITGGDRVLVPERQVGGLGAVVLENTTAQQLLDENLDNVLGRIPILIHDPAGDEWRVQFGADEVKRLRILQLKQYFYRTITNSFPEWKQLNIDNDQRTAIQWLSDWTGVPYLDVSAWLYNKLWPKDMLWFEQVQQPREIQSASLEPLVDEAMEFIARHRADSIGYAPERALVERRVRDAAYGMSVRNAIDALRAQSRFLEEEIRKLTTIDDIVHFNIPAVWW